MSNSKRSTRSLLLLNNQRLTMPQLESNSSDEERETSISDESAVTPEQVVASNSKKANSSKKEMAPCASNATKRCPLLSVEDESESCSDLMPVEDLRHHLDGSGTTKPPSIIVSFNDGTNFSEEGLDNTSIFEDDYNAGMYHGLRGRRYCLSTLRFFGLTIILWCFQYVVSSSMLGIKGEDTRNGMMSAFDFDPSLMAQRVFSQELRDNWASMINQTSNPLAATYFSRQSERPGYQLAQQGAQANYPVVMIPGFVTSGLEVWTSRECAKKYFRQRIWTGLDSARALFSDRNCWREHLALDPKTGLDPEGIRLRASEGFEAADYFMANYWVWEKLLENLADLGYSPSTMSIEPYDWRMAFPLLEERDGYMTKLMYKIEAMHKSTGKKVVLTSHSMGGQLVHFFFKWVTTPRKEGGGGGGKQWVDKHLHAYINIAGSHLGVPKAASALMSGEMSDTVIMGTIGDVVEMFLGRKLRKDLWNTWGSLWGMLPKGGSQIWDIGADVCDGVTDPEDPFCKDKVAGGEKKDDPIPLMLLRGKEESSSREESTKVTPEACTAEDVDNCQEEQEDLFEIPQDDGSIDATVKAFAQNERPISGDICNFLRDWGAGLGSALKYSSFYHNYGDTKEDNKAKVEWLDPTITPLPHAPNLKIYCMYGVGLGTERNYFYKVNSDATSGSSNPLMRDRQNQSSDMKSEGPNVELPFVLDTSVDDPERKIQHGIRLTDGDGSVPLLSLGYICADAWTREDSGLNPSGTKVVTLEYQNYQEFTPDDPFRGGPRSADHVDILGNAGMTEDFLRVVSDFQPKAESSIVSKLREYAKVINEHPRGGIFHTENQNRFSKLKRHPIFHRIRNYGKVVKNLSQRASAMNLEHLPKHLPKILLFRQARGLLNKLKRRQ